MKRRKNHDYKKRMHMQLKRPLLSIFDLHFVREDNYLVFNEVLSIVLSYFELIKFGLCKTMSSNTVNT